MFVLFAHLGVQSINAFYTCMYRITKVGSQFLPTATTFSKYPISDVETETCAVVWQYSNGIGSVIVG